MKNFNATGAGRVLGKTVELAALRKDGTEIVIELSVEGVRVDGERQAVGILRDITARKQTEQQIVEMARSDSLTGLASRRAFVDALQQEISRGHRGGNGFAVLYLDLDHFKDVNDTLGHPVGDMLLQAVAVRLRASVRVGDVIARFGGDEFAVIGVDIGEPSGAAILAGQLLEALSVPFQIEGNEIRCGASVGIAIYGPETSNAETLLSFADLALYRAKSDGRGTYRFFTGAMDDEVRTRVMLGAELRTAIESGQLFLLYQPQVEIETGRMVGIEALVRWNHPRRGVVGPDEFIMISEHIGLIVALGHWVMREACRQIRAWLDAGVDPCVVAVNVSGLQFKTLGELEGEIAAMLAEAQVAASRIEIELTETVLMEASLEHNDVLVRLRQSGLRLAIDDFGTGYSSLGYLRRFPVNRIKIAQSFVKDIGMAPDATAIVKAAIGLVDALGLEIIAEGVETEEQLTLLQAWGCHQVQGFYFAHPLPPEAITELLRGDRILPRPPPSAASSLPPLVSNPG
jgi:diguanylate cyclase (GGDEF)-like protein